MVPTHRQLQKLHEPVHTVRRRDNWVNQKKSIMSNSHHHRRDEMVCDGGVATSYTSALFEKTCPTFQQLERKVTFLCPEQRKNIKTYENLEITQSIRRE